MDKKKKAALDALEKGIKKKFGDSAILKGSEAGDMLEVRKFKTPSTEINNMLYGG